MEAVDDYIVKITRPDYAPFLASMSSIYCSIVDRSGGSTEIVRAMVLTIYFGRVGAGQSCTLNFPITGGWITSSLEYYVIDSSARNPPCVPGRDLIRRQRHAGTAEAAPNVNVHSPTRNYTTLS